MAAATPVGRPAASQVHVRDPVLASQPGCSQGQPARAVTAVAADQPPARPSRGRQRVQGAAALITWGGAFHLHEGAAHCEQISAVGRRKASGGQSGVRAAGAGGDRFFFDPIFFY